MSANIILRQGNSNVLLVGVAGPVGPGGAGGILGYYGAFSSYVDQTADSTTEAYPFRFEQTDESNGVSITQGTDGFPSRITFAAAGTYNIQFSAQFQNTDNSAHDVQIWLRKNEVDVTGSTGFVSVPAKHAGADGHSITGWNFVFTVAANDYYEFFWQTDDLDVSIHTYPGGTTPTTPSTASLVLTVTQVMNTQLGPTGPAGPAGPTGVVSATTPITYNSATQTVGITLGTGLTSSSGALVVELIDSTTSTSTTTAATPNSVKTAIDRIEDGLNQPSTGWDITPRTQTMGGVAIGNGVVNFSFFTPATNITISQISYAVAATTASGLTLSRFGLYTFDGTTATLVARTSSSTAGVFTSASQITTKVFDTTGGYPATYDLVAGTRYATAVVNVWSAGAGGNLLGVTGIASVFAATPRVNGSLSSSDLPTSTTSFGTPTTLYWSRVS
jgi:hypothetical protein